MIGGRPTWGMTHPDIMTVPPVFDEIDTLRTELARYDRDTTAVVGMFRRYLQLLEHDGLLLRDHDRLEIRRLLHRAQGQVTSTAVFLTGVVATIVGVVCASILMGAAASLGPTSFLLGALVGAVITGSVMRVGTRELESWTAHFADAAMTRLDERLP
ncbi:hypothetical protein ACFTZB_17690 [Rhodococcus sp. NPDC057014]|uniref:hypothetical protein n=1 Tax=Rhodococcus sp. NPDC057014 TaxID=3346000 RepID=UPI003630661A